jgi:hypothetical protein
MELLHDEDAYEEIFGKSYPFEDSESEDKLDPSADK